MSLNDELLTTTILSDPGKVPHDYAIRGGTTIRKVNRWLRDNEQARSLVSEGKVAVEEGKPLPEWAMDDQGQKLPAVPVAERTENTPVRDVGALILVPEGFEDERLDRVMGDFREREITKLGPNPKSAQVNDANLAVMKFANVLHTAHKDQIKREAADDAVAQRDEVIAEKDRRIQTMEMLLEAYQNNQGSTSSRTTVGAGRVVPNRH